MRAILFSFATVLAVLATNHADAAIATYSGTDDGPGPYTNSAAAEASFLAALSGLGGGTTIDFESLPTGYSSNFAAAPGVSVSLFANDYGSAYSGVTAGANGQQNGFNTTAGGANWLGFLGGNATFSFLSPIQAFGFYLTGTQTTLSTVVSVSFDDGNSQSFNTPINSDLGGASYFGFTDFGASISAITIGVDVTNGDGWGIDDVTFGPAVASVVPEPTSMALAGFAGIGMAVGAWRRRRQQAA